MSRVAQNAQIINFTVSSNLLKKSFSRLSSLRTLSTAVETEPPVPSYSLLRQQVIAGTRSVVTRDQIRAARKRTGPPKATIADKIQPKIAVPSIEKDEKTKQVLAQLSKERLYAVLEIKEKPYYVTVGDTIVTPRMNDVQIGDVLVMDRCSEIGSQDTKIQGNPFVHPSFFRVEATVMEHCFSKDNLTERKKKRGKNTLRHHRNGLTLLKVRKIDVIN